MSLPILLFDLDGTLTNPAPGFLASIRYAMDKLGVESKGDDELTKYIGPPLRETMGELLGTDDVELIERAVELYRWRLDHGGKFEANIIDGIPEVLTHFQQQGYPMYVCTGKPEGVATEIVERFGLARFFHKVYGAKLDGRHCDKAELIRHIWDEESIQTPNGVMIGDTIFDINAAKSNQLGSIGVRWGFGTLADLEQSETDVIVGNAAQLIPAIEKLIRELK